MAHDNLMESSDRYYPRARRARTWERRGRGRIVRRREAAMIDFFGEELAGLEIESKQPRTQELGELLDGVVEGLSGDDRTFLRTLIDAWPEITGGDVAQQASPRTLRDGVLYVEVYNAAWRYHLASYSVKRQVLEQIAKFSQGAVHDVVFRVGGATMRG